MSENEIFTLLLINMHLLDIRDRLTNSEFVHRQKWKWLRIQLVLIFAYLTERTNTPVNCIYDLKSIIHHKDNFHNADIQDLLSNPGLKITKRLDCIETAINMLYKKFNITTIAATSTLINNIE